jgi:hypothetical protein
VSWNRSSQNKSASVPPSYPRKRVSRSFDFPGFRVALAADSLPGMTPELFNGFRKHDTRMCRFKFNVHGLKRFCWLDTRLEA